MKKTLLSILIVIVLTGCSVQNIKTLEKEELAETILDMKSFKSNVNKIGYSYYMPREVSLIDSNFYNAVFKYGNDSIYMYVDLIEKYNNTEVKKDINPEDYYFFQDISSDETYGYLLIDKQDDKYYIELFYNYVTLTTKTNENNIYDMIINMAYLALNVKYNNATLEYLYGGEQTYGSSTNFTLFEKETKVEENFLDYNPIQKESY